MCRFDDSMESLLLCYWSMYVYIIVVTIMRVLSSGRTQSASVVFELIVSPCFKLMCEAANFCVDCFHILSVLRLFLTDTL